VPELFSEDFQDQAFEQSQLFFADQEDKYLEHIAPIVIFLYLFCRIRIACQKCLLCAPRLGFD
jgi:hypothetical protein